MSAPLPEKTVREWLEELPEPLRSEAFSDNQLTQNGRYLGEVVNSLSQAIDWGISWDDAHTEWNPIHTKLLKLERDQINAANGSPLPPA